MTIDEASSRLQSLLAFYDSLKYLSDIIQTARNTENLTKERDIAAKKTYDNLRAAQEALAVYQSQSDNIRADLATKLANEQRNYEATSTSLAISLAEANEKLEAVQTQLAAQEAQLNNIVETQTTAFIAEQHRLQAEAQDATGLLMSNLNKAVKEKQAQLEAITKSIDKIRSLTAGL